MYYGSKRPKASTEAFAAATSAVDQLQDALARVGIQLPSLGVDLVSATSPLHARPLIELGRCNMETAQALIAVLRGAAPVPVGAEQQ
ncbi:hypothetical protein [Streptomyces avicenniae]|uniref:hypothetical protein n=1 Tax=Streptomyces avicenniae TaxID=500153 RepID=UPI00069A825C|nr:hypothetical protein [Streptomyces avicenniae]